MIGLGIFHFKNVLRKEERKEATMSQRPKKNYGPDGMSRFYLQSPRTTDQLSAPPFCTQLPVLLC